MLMAVSTVRRAECAGVRVGGCTAPCAEQAMKTILVVDDMAIFREPIAAVLRSSGFRAIPTANGKEALTALQAHRPDLVLLDLGMPGLDGIEVLRQIRADKQSCGTPVIVLTADADRHRVMDAAKLQVSCYLLKSEFSLKALMDRVHAVLGSRQSAASIAPADAGVPVPLHAGAPSQPAVRKAEPGQPLGPERSTSAQPPSPGGFWESSWPNQAITTLEKMPPLIAKADLQKRLATVEELKGFSPTVSHILKIATSAQSSVDEIAKAASQDQAVALKIMRLANSVAFSRGDRVDTLHKAVLRIGVGRIRDAALSIGVVERFSAASVCRHLDASMFWEHAIACGIIAAELAHELKHKQADVAFMAGLLHDLGRLILAEALDETYGHVLSAAQELGLPVETVESRLLGVNHAEIMSQLLRAWRFPKDLVIPITSHHLDAGDMRPAAGDQVQESLRLGLADRVAHALMLGASGNDTVYPMQEHCRLLKLDPAALARIVSTAREQTDEVKFALLARSSGSVWPRRAEHHRASLIGEFRPLCVSAAPEFDAYRLLCDMLADPPAGRPPNIAIVHIASGKEVAQWSDALHASENAAGVRNLPTLVLSPGASVILPADAGRLHKFLPTPVPVAVFIALINQLLESAGSRKAA